MKSLVGVAVALTLVGCGSPAEESDNNHGLGFGFTDRAAVSDIRVRRVNADSLSPQAVDSIYTTARQCAGMPEATLAPMYLLFDPHIGERFTNKGAYFSDTSTIAIDSSIPIFIQVGAEQFFRHELMHHFLFVTTGNVDIEHHSKLFDDCADPLLKNVVGSR